jgi:hypothetical protein
MSEHYPLFANSLDPNVGHSNVYDSGHVPIMYTGTLYIQIMWGH